MSVPDDPTTDAADTRDGNAALDPAALDALQELDTGTSADLLADLLDAFSEHGAVSVERMHAGAADDPAAVAKAAHEFRGTAATFGANSLVALCEEIEQHAESRDRGGLPDLVSRLEQEIGRVHLALREEIASRRG